jgi:hypothetical protein
MKSGAAGYVLLKLVAPRASAAMISKAGWSHGRRSNQSPLWTLTMMGSAMRGVGFRGSASQIKRTVSRPPAEAGGIAVAKKCPWNGPFQAEAAGMLQNQFAFRFWFVPDEVASAALITAKYALRKPNRHPVQLQVKR